MTVIVNRLPSPVVVTAAPGLTVSVSAVPASVAPSQMVAPVGIGSSSAVGTPTLAAAAIPPQTVSSVGIASASAIGTPSVTVPSPAQTIAPAGIASTAQVGVVTVSLTLQPLSVSPNTATAGTPYSATISGKTAGSTLALSGAGAAGLSIAGTTISGTPTTAGAVDIVETLAGATNSPRTTSGAVTVGAALPSLYLGQVATNSRIPANRSTTNKQFNSRSRHVARDDITAMQIKLPAWYWARKGNFLENVNGGSITYRASIEYPADTFTQVKFGGANSGVAADNTDLLSDAVTVSIPNDAEFFVRVFGSSATAIVFTDGEASPASAQADATRGEAMEFAASGLTDKTMGGTITPTLTTVGAPIFSPVAILAQTRKPSVFIFGDSRGWGALDVYSTNENLGEVARSLGKSFGYINAGSAGDRMGLYLTSKARRSSLAQHCSHVISEIGINDLRSGGTGQSRTAAAVLADLQTAYADFSGKTIFQQTVTPQSNSSNGWTNEAGQTLNANAAQIAAFNDAVRAGQPGVAGFFEVADVAETARNSGKWKAGYTSDGLHANPTGYAAIEASGVYDPARITR